MKIDENEYSFIFIKKPPSNLGGFYEVLLMTHSQTNIKKFISNGIELFVTALVLVGAFFMTLFVLAATVILALVVAFKLRWRQPTPLQQPVDSHSKKTIIDAEYTVIEK